VAQARAWEEGARVVIVGAAGFTNLGDDAILAAMLGELRESLPGATFVVAGGPDEWLAAQGVQAIAVRDLQAVDAAIAEADLVIVGGGGFVYDYDGRISPYRFLLGDDTFMYPYYRAAVCASVRDVPLYFYAIGVDSLVTRVGRALTRDVLSLASAITVRDRISLLELHRAGVRCDTVEVTADPAVRLPTAESDWRSRPTGRVVAFLSRPWLRWGNTWTSSAAQLYDTYVGWLAAAADRAVEAWDATPVFLPGQRYNDPDLETAERVVERMTHGERARLLAEVVDAEQYRAVFAGADAVVSTRLHPLILATVAHVPVVGVAITEKVRAYLAALDLHDQVVSPWTASSHQIRRALDRALGEAESIRERMSAGLELQRAAAARNPELARELLASRPGVLAG
jgi:polysaccharide pyruvyl transferase WcaK-like protein